MDLQAKRTLGFQFSKEGVVVPCQHLESYHPSFYTFYGPAPELERAYAKASSWAYPPHLGGARGVGIILVSRVEDVDSPERPLKVPGPNSCWQLWELRGVG